MNRKPHRKEARRIITQKRRENGYYKEMYKNNPEQFKKYNQQHRNHNIADEQFESCKKYFKYERCFCGMSEEEAIIKYKQRLHKEHADDDGANDLSNCIPACKGCNSSKWKFELKRWYLQQDFYSEERLQKINKWLNEDYKKFI